MTTVREVVSPELLFESLLTRNIGWFHTDGITVRKSIFERTGFFDEHLELRQDTAMWLKMAAVGKLAPGNLDQPVSMRRVHSENRVSASQDKFNYFGLLLWETLAQWAMKNSIEKTKMELLVDKYVGTQFGQFSKSSRPLRKWQQAQILINIAWNQPTLLSSPTYWKYLRIALGLPKTSL